MKPLVLRATSFITKPARHPPPPPLTIEEAIAALASAEPGAASAFSKPKRLKGNKRSAKGEAIRHPSGLAGRHEELRGEPLRQSNLLFEEQTHVFGNQRVTGAQVGLSLNNVPYPDFFQVSGA